MKLLSRIGGTDVVDTVRRMLSFLTHNDLAVSMNWTGACNKRAACDLLSMEVVQEMQMPWLTNRITSEASGAELLVHMRRWFRNARDRAGGRTRRIKPHTPKDVDLDAD
ncbi:hypothetical protein AHF37_12460 [Paragonimus kellicotti]|nr:hypothetical protein AHF37_12460 [Paragonimus kellicotti]